MRKTTGSAALLLAAMGMSVSGPAAALGLGGLEVDSALFRPFRARIPLHGLQGVNGNDIHVGLAPAGDFLRLGLERPAALKSLSFRVSERDGAPHIEILSRAPQREPVVQFLLSIEWPGGHLLREYTALLDPPDWAPQQPEVQAPAVQSSQLSSAPRFTQPEPVVAIREPAASVSQPADTQYGPVRSGETLGRIARRYSGANVNLNQAMLALLRANPQAFTGGNINRLQRGAMLRIPSAAEFRALTPQQAAAVVAEHHGTRAKQPSVQKALASTAPATPPAAAQPVVKRAPVATPAAATDNSTQVRLVAAEQETSGASLDVLAEGASLSQQVADLRRIIELKEEQIASAEAALASRDAELKTLRTLVDLREAELQEMRVDIEALKIAITPVAGSANPALSTAPAVAAPLVAGVAAAPQAASTPAAVAIPVTSTSGESSSVWMDNKVLTAALLALPALLAGLWYALRRRRRASGSSPQPAARRASTYVAGNESQLRATLDNLQTDELARGESSVDESVFDSLNDDSPGVAPAARAVNPAAPASVPAAAERNADGTFDQTESDATLIVSDFNDGTEARPVVVTETVETVLESPAEAAVPQIDFSLPEAEMRLLDEIDVYLAYGLYDQAQQLIRQGLERDPGKPVLLARRLEALLLADEHEQFQALASEYRNVIEAADWARLSERASTLSVAMPDASGGAPKPAASAEPSETSALMSMDIDDGQDDPLDQLAVWLPEELPENELVEDERDQDEQFDATIACDSGFDTEVDFDATLQLAPDNDPRLDHSGEDPDDLQPPDARQSNG